MPAATLQPPATAFPSRTADRTDEQLARAAGRGDVAAFEALYARHHLALLSFSRHMLGRAHDAEDVVQHTFLAADQAFRGGKVPKAVRAWLYTVARNRCISVLRARREDAGLPGAELPSTENLVADVEQRADLRDLLADLRKLPDDQRAALLLTELGDLTHAEVATVIGVRTNKVKALVFQAREALLAAAHARTIPCHTIREELANATAAGLRRRHLRNHLAQCEGCNDFAAAVRAQRVAIAALLPVVPTLALRDGVLSGIAAGAGTAAGAGAGAGAGMLVAKSTAAKVLTTIAVGGAAAGGGVAVTAIDSPPPRDAGERQAERVRSAPAPAGTQLLPADVSGPGAVPIGRPAPVERGGEDGTGRGARSRAPSANGRSDASGRPARTRPGQARKEGAIPPGQAKVNGRDKAKGQANGNGNGLAKVKAPKLKAPKLKVPNVNVPKAKAPTVEAPKTRAPSSGGAGSDAPSAARPPASGGSGAPAASPGPRTGSGSGSTGAAQEKAAAPAAPEVAAPVAGAGTPAVPPAKARKGADGE